MTTKLPMIIGSVALKHWFPDARHPVDIDFLTPHSVTVSTSKFIVETQWHELPEWQLAMEIIERDSSSKVFADPNILLTLKLAHAYWNIHHAKTLFDIHFLQQRGAVVNEELHSALVAVWKQVHGKSPTNLNKTMADFFNDAVVRTFDHEWVHEQIAFSDRPHHERLRPDMSLVWCDKRRFDDFTDEERLETALEEIMVTAIERFNLTPESKLPQIMRAMTVSHRKLCTTMASGWFARYNIEHHHEMLYARREKWYEHLIARLVQIHSHPSPKLISGSSK